MGRLVSRFLGLLFAMPLGLLLLVPLGLPLGAAAQAAQAAQAPLDLPTLTGLLAQRKSGEARFTEERFVSGLDGPLRASGVLSFRAPDRFVRQTLEPLAESMEVEGNTITLRRGGRSRQMAMDAVPEVAALLEAVRATLTGNAAALQKHFTVKVEGTAANWALTLKPRDARLATQVREVLINGQGSEMRTVGLWLAGGDRSLMVIDSLRAAGK